MTFWVLPGYYDGRRLRDDFQTMTRAVAAYAEPGDALLLVSGDRFPLFQFRYDVLPSRAQLPDVTTLSVVKVTPQDVERVLAPLAQNHKRVWLAEVEKNLQDSDGLLAGWLDKNRHAVWREGYGYNRLSLYSIDNELPIANVRMGYSSERWVIYYWGMVEVELLGYDLPVREVGPGDVAHLVAYFKYDEPLTLTMMLRSFPKPGTDPLVLETRTERVEPRSGMARVRFDVPVYARTPPGEYNFLLNVSGLLGYVSRRGSPESPSSETATPETMHNGGAVLPLTRRLRIVGTPPLEIVTSIPNPRSYRIGQSIHLEGYQAPTQVKPGGQLPVKLCWRAVPVFSWTNLATIAGKPTERYTVFVQLVGTQYNPKTNGPLWAGHDSEPLDGGYPTTQWFVNVPIADTHILTIPSDVPPGEYELWAGMYTQPDIKRLPVYDAQGNLVGDHVILEKIKVSK